MVQTGSQCGLLWTLLRSPRLHIATVPQQLITMSGRGPSAGGSVAKDSLSRGRQHHILLVCMAQPAPGHRGHAWI